MVNKICKLTTNYSCRLCLLYFEGTPDIYLWNQEEAMTDNLANTYATVSSDGSVFWSRPGRIKSTCKYTGLENFPFDKLGCALEFGSWTHSGLYLRPTKLGGTGYSIGGSETAGGSFVEFELIGDEVQVDEVIYPPFDCKNKILN